MANQTLITPFTSTGPYVVSADVSDNNSVAASTINWMWGDTGTTAVADFDSVHYTDPNTGSGTYYYTIADTAMFGHHWANGDSILFYADATDGNNNYTAFYNQIIIVGQAYLGVSDHPSAGVSNFNLIGNYPNPFNPTTDIAFELPGMYRVTIKVYNTLGQEVATLTDGELFTAGRHTLAFDGSRLTSGVYFYRMSAGPYAATHKMVLLK